MADRYWVGGSGTWNSTNVTNWSNTSNGAGGFSVPVAGDNVFFDEAVSSGSTISNAGNKSFQDITVSGSNITIAGNVAMTITGNMILASTTQWTGSGTLTFSNTTQKTISTNGVSIEGNTTFGTAGSSWIFASAFTTTKIITHNNGILDFANFNITCAIFLSNSDNLRSIIMGSSNVYLTSTVAGATVLNINAMTNLTFTSTTGSFVSNASVAKTYTLGTTGTTDISKSAGLTLTGSGTRVATLTSGSYFKTLDFGSTTFTVPTTAVYLLSNLTLGNGTYTGLTTLFSGSASCTINGNGKTIPILNLTFGSNSITLASALTVSGTTTLTSGTLDLAGFTLTTANFSSNNTNNRSITFDAANIVLTNSNNGAALLDMAQLDNLTISATTGGFSIALVNSSNVARSISCGGTSGNTEFNMPNITFTGTGASVASGTGFNFGAFIFVGAFNCSAASGGIFRLVETISCKSFSLGANADVSNGSFNTYYTGTISSANNFLFKNLAVRGDTTLASAIAVSVAATLVRGTLDLAGFTLTTPRFDTLSIPNPKNLIFNGSILTCTAATTTAWNNSAPAGFTTTAGTGTGVINMTAATAKTFVGGVSTVYNCTLNQGGAGALTVTGNNTFSNITNTVQPASVLFTAGSTNSFTQFNLNGTAGNLITLGSVTAASHTLSKASGVVNSNYLSISRSTATGGATWYAGANSTNGGNNTGWSFSSAISQITGQFMSFFF